MKKEINVVGAIIVDGTKVLAARRGAEMSLPGMWEFPGGKIEAGETPREALIRELQEELLCTAEIGHEVVSTRHEYDLGFVTLTTFYSKLLDDEPRLTEHSEIRWLEAANLNAVEWAPADIPAVDIVMKDFSMIEE